MVRKIDAVNGVHMIGTSYFAARYGAAPMWSKCACVSTIAFTFALQSLIAPSCGIASAFFSDASVFLTNSPISSSLSLM